MDTYEFPDFKISKEFKNDLEKLGELANVNSEIIEIFLSNLYREDYELDSDLKKSSYFIFCKGFKTFNAIRALNLCGFGVDALSLTSTLIENLINLSYLQKRPDTANRFLSFEQVKKYNLIRKILQRADLQEDSRKQYTEQLSHLSHQVKDILHECHAPYCWFETAKKGKFKEVTLRDRAEDVGLGILYQTEYSMLCSYKHTGPDSASGAMFHSDDGSTQMILGSHIRGVFYAFSLSSKYFLKILQIVDEVFSWNLKSDISRLFTKIEQTEKKILENSPELFK